MLKVTLASMLVTIQFPLWLKEKEKRKLQFNCKHLKNSDGGEMTDDATHTKQQLNVNIGHLKHF